MLAEPWPSCYASHNIGTADFCLSIHIFTCCVHIRFHYEYLCAFALRPSNPAAATSASPPNSGAVRLKLKALCPSLAQEGSRRFLSRGDGASTTNQAPVHVTCMNHPRPFWSLNKQSAFVAKGDSGLARSKPTPSDSTPTSDAPRAPPTIAQMGSSGLSWARFFPRRT